MDSYNQCFSQSCQFCKYAGTLHNWGGMFYCDYHDQVKKPEDSCSDFKYYLDKEEC